MNIEGISWRAFEFAHRPKTSDWFWAVGIVTVGAVVAAIFFNNIVLAILIIVAALALLLHANKSPRLLEYHLTMRGLIIDKKLYPISTIESFWIDEYENGVAKMILKSTKKIMLYIIVPLVPEVTPDEVRHFFFQHRIKEVEHHEPTSQQIMEYLGF
ncbi:TPA: hypothetical protein DCQ44_02320 [Candidatus Taylorbacteria bacterium]|nr:hypothetical protein [Candidatus Taylorbacteria bacterium]